MIRKIALLLAFVAITAAGQSARAEAITASVVKVRGKVLQISASGGSVPLLTGDSVVSATRVTVPRMGTAVFRVGDDCVIKEEPSTSVSFTRLVRSSMPKGKAWGIDYTLQKGEIYSAVKKNEPNVVDCHITTSRIEAVTHGAVFKITHFNSTSSVFVREGLVEVLYCRNTKRALVHAGEAFIVTDCDGFERWLTDDDMRQLSLFASTTDSAFRMELANATPILPVVLAPEVPPQLPEISP